jgi:hypothetical protein
MAPYLLAALLLWTSWITPSEDRASPSELSVWANAIAAHCGSDIQRCTFLAALAFEESGFRVHVLNEDCNSASWRASHRESKCDDGFAWGPFQLHRGPWLRGADPAHATPDEQARIASLLPEGAWARVTRRLGHALAASYIRTHPLQ